MWGGWNTRPQRKSEKHTCLVLYNGVNLGLHMKARSCQVVTQTTPVRTVLQRSPACGMPSQVPTSFGNCLLDLRQSSLWSLEQPVLALGRHI